MQANALTTEQNWLGLIAAFVFWLPSHLKESCSVFYLPESSPFPQNFAGTFYIPTFSTAELPEACSTFAPLSVTHIYRTF